MARYHIGDIRKLVEQFISKRGGTHRIRESKELQQLMRDLKRRSYGHQVSESELEDMKEKLQQGLGEHWDHNWDDKRFDNELRELRLYGSTSDKEDKKAA